MVKWKLKCVKLLDGFSFLPSDKASGLTGNIQLVEIALIHEQPEVIIDICLLIRIFYFCNADRLRVFVSSHWCRRLLLLSCD